MKPDKALTSSGNDEWFTPQWVITRARAVMGDIQLDPASCSLANKMVKAEQYYSHKEGMDGLNLSWQCRTLWLNPPYSDTRSWVEMFLLNWMSNEIKDMGMVLTNANIGTTSINMLIRWCSAFGMFKERIRFAQQAGQLLKEGPAPSHGNMIFLFSRDEWPASFINEFREHAYIVSGESVYGRVPKS